MSFKHDNVKQEKGIVILELALVIGLGILIVSGIVDYGSALQEHSVMVDAARMGARAAARHPSPTSPQLTQIAINSARTFLELYGNNPDNYQYAVADASDANSVQIRLSVQRTSNRFIFLVATSFPSCAASVFRIQSNVPPEPTANIPPC